ncbi:unnamed protein product [Cunninghamella blakesleeana]
MFKTYRNCNTKFYIRLLILSVFFALFLKLIHFISLSSLSIFQQCNTNQSIQECFNHLKKQQQVPLNLIYNNNNKLFSNNIKKKTKDEYIQLTQPDRVKAAFVVLVRNNELHAMRSSMKYLENSFNHKYNYPWIFLNEVPFTQEFINQTSSMTDAKVEYGLIPKEHWSYPSWINQTYAAECRKEMENQQIIYGGSESYRHMCRYQSGFFFLHPLLDELDYYWRVEPGVKFSCDIDYDPFKLMKERDLKYGFTLALKELYETIPTLWNTTLDFIKDFPQYIYPTKNEDSLYRLITDDNGENYNLCHFWSNFEIASLDFVRSEGYRAYFDYLDKKGGFFYERWGDAPVHSIAVALMLSKKDVHWFYDIGYKHDYFEHCPTEPNWLTFGKCYCDPRTSFGIY